MSKTANREAAKAYQREWEEREAAKHRQAEINADLAALEAARKHFLGKRGSTPLIEAIDDHVERLTGDRTKLHARAHTIP